MLGSGLGLRIAITLLTAAQAMIAALLAFGEVLPQEAKIGLVVATSGLAVVLNQIPSWQSAAKAEKVLAQSSID